MSTSEQTYADKLAAFTHFKDFLMNLNPAYNPPSLNLGIESITTVETAASTSQTEYREASAAYGIAKSARDVVFEPLKDTVRSVFALSKALGFENGVITQIKRLVDSITGTSSVAHQGMQNQVSIFGDLISVLKSVPGYTPNRESLTIAGLEAYYTNLSTTMENTIQKDLLLTTAIQNRKEAFGSETGIVAKTRQVKLYLKSLWGQNSPLYKEAMSITKIIK